MVDLCPMIQYMSFTFKSVSQNKYSQIALLQVTCEYCMSHGACVPLRVHTVVVSVQHSEKISLEELRADVMTKVIRVVIPEKYLDDGTTFHINPCGLFVVGGPLVSGCRLTVLFNGERLSPCPSRNTTPCLPVATYSMYSHPLFACSYLFSVFPPLVCL
jgi:hypothetical protein